MLASRMFFSRYGAMRALEARGCPVVKALKIVSSAMYAGRQGATTDNGYTVYYSYMGKGPGFSIYDWNAREYLDNSLGVI